MLMFEIFHDFFYEGWYPPITLCIFTYLTVSCHNVMIGLVTRGAMIMWNLLWSYTR